jgi:osmoprotectant transport system permease protein
MRWLLCLLLVCVLPASFAQGNTANEPPTGERTTATVETDETKVTVTVEAGGDTASDAPSLDRALRVGSKSFTESVLLSWVLTYLLRDAGLEAEQKEFVGTGLVWQALRTGQIDAYVEYTGTLRQELFAGERLETREQLRDRLAEDGLRMSAPLGFNNTYALGTTREIADQYNLETIADLRAHPELRFGFSNEFMEREDDGWLALQEAYELPQTDVRGLDQRLAYEALVTGRSIDVMDCYATDAQIEKFDLVILEDNRNFFPSYFAVVLYRAALAEQAPAAVAALKRLEGLLDDPRMRSLNAKVVVEGKSERQAAADFVAEAFDITVTDTEPTVVELVAKYTVQHLYLVGISLGLAIVVAIPLGVLAYKVAPASQPILGATGIIQTIPALAMLVLLMPVLSAANLESVGNPPAIVALFLYSLLPIVRNTHAGLVGIANSVRESAIALGLPAAARLWKIELPLASPTILAGIKTAAVINVGYATLGAFIGAGGYGQPILTGLRRNDLETILIGAIPAAALALLVQGLFELAERLVVPKGLRLDR